jgi:CRP/FNR family transcriptional regulator, cyclic AMP receptor protein
VKNLAELLNEFPLTKGMRDEHRELIAGCGKNVVYEPGTYLFREGEKADTFWAIRKGKVALEVYAPPRGALVVETVATGEALGWSWLFPPYRFMFDARVLQTTRAIAFDGACLRGKTESDHELGYQLMLRMAEAFTKSLAATRWQLLDVYGQPAQG